MSFDRYRDIIPDWPAFRSAVSTPERPTLRVRVGTTDREALAARLQDQGFRLLAIEGLADFFRVDDGPDSVAQTLEHWLGLFHVQQAVMAIPSLALSPRPGEAVLDLCAAPGGKTAHLAELMADRGPLVAVDPKEKRLRGLLGNLYRLGHPNVLVVAADGRTLPEGASFDRVLVDAPCSAEGNVRRQGGRSPNRTPGFVRHVTSLQETLLRRGIRLTRPGGLAVYSTCTFAPEENEAVLDRVIRSEPVRIEKIPLSLPHDPGLDEWDGSTFHPDVRKAWRVYPHHLDSGGLFVARLRRLSDEGGAVPPLEETPSAPLPGWSPVPAAFPGESEADADARLRNARSELRDRYGLPASLLDSLGWIVRKENIWAHTAGHWPVDAWSEPGREGRWRVVSLGIRALRRGAHGHETPSSHFLSRWGDALAPERRVELPPEALRRLLDGEHLPAGDLPTGPVALVWEGIVVGRGMVGRRGLSHEIARAYAERLRTILA